MAYAVTPLPPCAHTGQTPAPPNISTPSPCQIGSDPAWSGPNPCFYRICTDTVWSLGGPNEPKCCYWVAYHQRMIPNSQGTGYERYEVNVVGIFYDGEDCELRSRGEIIHAFQNALYKKLDNDDPTFFDNHYMPSSGGGSGDLGASQYFYTTGGCFEKDSNRDVVYDEFGIPVNCDTNVYCCEYTKQVHYKKNYLGETKIWSIDSLNSQNPNPVIAVTKNGDDALCDTNSCKPACDNVLMASAAMALCDAPCNDGMWTQETVEIPLPFCPGCTVVVEYKTREIDQCPDYGMESVNDIYLDKIRWDNMELGTPCATCSVALNSVHAFVIDHLLKNNFPRLPAPNQCKNHYRLFQAACWFDHYQEPYEGWPPRRHLVQCGEENCCYHRYRICRSSSGTVTYTLLETQNNTVDCHVYPYPCIYVCEPNPPQGE